MKILALTVLLAVMQTSSPVPRKTADTSASGSHNVAQETKDNQRSSDAHSVIAPQATGQNQNEGQNPSDTNAKKTVIICESAPMPPAGADWWFRAYVFFTGALVVVGAIGICAAYKTLRAIERQAEVMNKTLIATFRPRLILRNIALSEGTNIPAVGVPDAKPWKVDFVLANTGGSPANLVNHSVEVSAFEKGLPPRLPYKPQQFMKPQRLETGDNRELELSVEIDHKIVSYFRLIGTKSEWDMSHQTIGHVYFWGRFQYSDDLTIVRNIAFCRHYNTKTGKFDPIDDPDYEYAD